jgi:zinc transport system permease protein
VIFYGGIAGGVVLIGLSKGGSAAKLNSYLFGAITTTSPQDLTVFAGLATVVLLVAVGLAPRLFAVSNDEEYARASGMNVLGLNLLLAVLTAATVVISMRVVGLLLISALMIVPNAVAQQVARSFRGSMLIAVTVGVVVSVTGTASSYYLETPSGGTIVLLAVGVFIVSALAATATRAAHARRHHSATEHRHEHGIDCGHEIVAHDDHLDYVHDGHRHAAHGAHYDDH